MAKKVHDPPVLDAVQLFFVVGANRRIRYVTRDMLDAMAKLKEQEADSSVWRADKVLLATKPRQSKSVKAAIEKLAYNKEEPQED